MNKIFILLLMVSVGFTKEIEIFIDSMHCPLCTTIVRKSLLKVDGVKSAKVSLKTRTALVNTDEKIDEKSLLEATKSVGYPGVIKEKK